MPVEHDERGRFAASAGAAADKGSAKAAKATAKAGKAASSTWDRIEAHGNAREAHLAAAAMNERASSAYQKAAWAASEHAGTVERSSAAAGNPEAVQNFHRAGELAKKGDEYAAKAAEHRAAVNEHQAKLAPLESRPSRQAAFIKSELESKVPGAKVTVGELSSAGGHHVVVEHEPSGSRRTMGVSKYGVTPGEVNYGSATRQHPTNGTMVESGRGKFEKTLQATLNKAKKLDARDYVTAAKKCLKEMKYGQPGKLDAADRAGMLEELALAGVDVSVLRGDAYVAARYDASFNETKRDADWDESQHPRGEGGKFGAAAAQSKAEAAAGTAFHKELALNGGKAGAPSHKEVGAAFRESQAAYKQAAEAHQAEGSKNLAGFHESKSAEQGRVAEFHESAASKIAAAATPNPADKLTPGMKAAGATEYAKAMSKEAKKSGTPEAHMAASAAHTAAAERHRAMGSESAAKDHDKKAMQEKISAKVSPHDLSQGLAGKTIPATTHAMTGRSGQPITVSVPEKESHSAATNKTGWREQLGKGPAKSEPSREENGKAAQASVKASKASRNANTLNTPEAHREAITAHAKAANLNGKVGQEDIAAGHREKMVEHGSKINESAGPNIHTSGAALTTKPTQTVSNKGMAQTPVERNQQRFPVGAQVVSGRAPSMGSPESFKQHYGTVVGHHPETGHPQVKFENGQTRHVNPSREYEGLSRTFEHGTKIKIKK